MENQQKWLAVDVTLAPEAVEAVEYALSEAGADGTEYNTLGIKEIRETVTVIGYFEESPDLQTIEAEIENALKIYNLSPDSVKNISLREVENQDWLAEWKKNWRPTITDKFIIAPVWSEITDTDKIVIRIEPSMAFGTGTHETTRLCLKAIEEYFQPAMSFLDVGTGTGILAIAASKYRAQSAKRKPGSSKDQALNVEAKASNQILACDTDEDSVVIAEENAVLNDAEEIDFYVGSITAETPVFDFVCANLTADVIIPLLPILVKKFRHYLVLSGILVEQRDSVVEELRTLGINNAQIETDGEWISVVVDNG